MILISCKVFFGITLTPCLAVDNITRAKEGKATFGVNAGRNIIQLLFSNTLQINLPKDVNASDARAKMASDVGTHAYFHVVLALLFGGGKKYEKNTILK